MTREEFLREIERIRREGGKKYKEWIEFENVNGYDKTFWIDKKGYLRVFEKKMPIHVSSIHGMEFRTASSLEKTDMAFSYGDDEKVWVVDHRILGVIKNILGEYITRFYSFNVPEKWDGGDFIICRGILCGYIGKEVKVIIPDKVIAIGEDAFKYNKWIKEAVLPESVKKIGDSAFCCTRLEKINLENVINVGNSSFSGCSRLRDIELGKAETIGDEAFSLCEGLRHIKIPKSVKKIGNDIIHCSGLISEEMVENESGFQVKLSEGTIDEVIARIE